MNEQCLRGITIVGTMFRIFGMSQKALSLIKLGSVAVGPLDATFLVSGQQASCLNDSLVNFYVLFERELYKECKPFQNFDPDLRI